MCAQSTDYDEAQIEAGRKLFAQECTFLLGVASLDQLPGDSLPEIAFAGRSNVGKSSLINALTGRKDLARTSNTPGRTQQLNFFDLGGQLMIADLPGYGFAAAPKDIVRQWQKVIDKYLQGRAPLRRVCMLIDSRHGMKEVDHKVMAMLDKAAVVYQVVLTKVDKISTAQLEKTLENIKKEMARHVAAHPVIMCTSSAKKLGIEELRAELASLT